MLGERWSLLIARDLSVAPRRFKDLHEGLPGVPTSVLTARLRDLQVAGVVTRVADERPGGGVLYALTPHGRALETILDALGRWGAGAMAAPGPQDVITDASLAAALRASYQPRATCTTTSYLIHTGAATAWAEATPTAITVGLGVPDLLADLTIHSGPELRAVLAGDLSPAAALSSGAVRIEGSSDVFERFVRTFHVPLTEAAMEVTR
ncbi:winged helix-turn-helix transcriptional regulator [Prauserella marina]|uniref:winged helix-turn-helix transcriptional regulator n=1 Tax=Prauserella marina TaxID=530584 RepID=UPI00147582D0|nr:helix-turn-helix domain-containing protein [Prauserella marina]